MEPAGPAKKARVIAVPTLDDGDSAAAPAPAPVPAAFLQRTQLVEMATPPTALRPSAVLAAAPLQHQQLQQAQQQQQQAQQHQPTRRSAGAPSSSSTQFRGTPDVLVSSRQRDNPVMQQLRNVSCVFADVPADFHINQDVGVLFLSLKFHLLNRRYIAGRLEQMSGYKQRVLLCLVDTDGVDAELVELAADCIAKQATLLLGWSQLECARYVETLKLYEHKSADFIKGEQPTDFADVFSKSLTSVRAVNSSDVLQLGNAFHTMPRVAAASVEELLLCPGLGAKKARRLHECFRQPFTNNNK